MRVLHVVKTSDGAWWAARQAAELVRQGVEVHVAVPRPEGRAMAEWRASGACVHVCPLDLPVRAPWRMSLVCESARRLVREVSPDVIHSHFAGTTVVLRLALGRRHPAPRIFQVPGPLHLEHRAYRTAEVATAGPNDFWIGTSKYIVRRYRQAGVSSSKLFLSYHGGSAPEIPTERNGSLRRPLGIPDGCLVVGNANFIYPPKWYLGQRVGLKCHEDVIDALAIVLRQRSDVAGVLVGGVFGNDRRYEQRLRDRARQAGGGRIQMPGYVNRDDIAAAWPDFDCAVHVPLSENCGGVIEPLLAGVPTIAARVGGLPEIVKDGVTGKTVNVRRPEELAHAILEVLDDLERYRALARKGRDLVRNLFDVRRTAAEVLQVYREVLERRDAVPSIFRRKGAEPCIG